MPLFYFFVHSLLTTIAVQRYVIILNSMKGGGSPYLKSRIKAQAVKSADFGWWWAASTHFVTCIINLSLGLMLFDHGSNLPFLNQLLGPIGILIALSVLLWTIDCTKERENSQKNEICMNTFTKNKIPTLMKYLAL